MEDGNPFLKRSGVRRRGRNNVKGEGVGGVRRRGGARCKGKGGGGLTKEV